MVDFILILLLILGLLIGIKRGLILQTFHLIGFIISFIVSVIYFRDLANSLELWIPYPSTTDESILAGFLQSQPLETAFYNAIAFAMIFFVTKIILQIIASMLDFVASLPILNVWNKLLGAVLGFIETYLLLFIGMYIVVLLPIEKIQHWIDNSSVALFIIEKTPYFSERIMELWFVSSIILFK